MQPLTVHERIELRCFIIEVGDGDIDGGGGAEPGRGPVVGHCEKQVIINTPQFVVKGVIGTVRKQGRRKSSREGRSDGRSDGRSR